MSRLHIGCLALVLDSVDEDLIGEVVLLLEHDGLAVSPHDGNVYNYWSFNFEGELCSLPDFCLMPLGDKQTLDELAKEVEEV
jgi:hypothetical protein